MTQRPLNNKDPRRRFNPFEHMRPLTKRVLETQAERAEHDRKIAEYIAKHGVKKIPIKCKIEW